MALGNPHLFQSLPKMGIYRSDNLLVDLFIQVWILVWIAYCIEWLVIHIKVSSRRSRSSDWNLAQRPLPKYVGYRWGNRTKPRIPEESPSSHHPSQIYWPSLGLQYCTSQASRASADLREWQWAQSSVPPRAGLLLRRIERFFPFMAIQRLRFGTTGTKFLTNLDRVNFS